MKHLIITLLLGVICLGNLVAQTSFEDVRKNASTNNVTESFDIPTGVTLGVDSGGTVNQAVGSVWTYKGVTINTLGNELNFLSGVTSAVQTQLDAKANLASPVFTGVVTIPSPFTLGATSVTTSGAELNFVDGVTSNVQTQLDGKQPLDAFLTTIAGTDNINLATQVTGTLPVANGGTGQTTLSNAVQALLDELSTTQGAILYRNATDWVALGPGTTGFLLKSTGAGANPVWTDPTGVEVEFTYGYNYITGFGLVYLTGTSISLGGGTCRDAANAENITSSSFITKFTTAWAVGSGEGGLDTGTIADGWYHVWVIKRTDTGVVDALYSLSASAPTMPPNYDSKRRVGSFFRTGGAIKPFLHHPQENHFTWLDAVIDVNAVATGTSAQIKTLTVPTAIECVAEFNLNLATAANMIVTTTAQTDVAATVANGAISYGSATGGGSPYRVKASGDATIRTRSSANVNMTISTWGWFDYRTPQ